MIKEITFYGGYSACDAYLIGVATSSVNRPDEVYQASPWGHS